MDRQICAFGSLLTQKQAAEAVLRQNTARLICVAMKLYSRIFTICAIFIAAIVISNMPVVRRAIMVIANDPEYKKTNFHYCTAAEAGFSVWSRKGYEDVLEQFAVYKQTHPGDTVLYRNFQVDYRKF
jgi:hypothetical protein